MKAQVSIVAVLGWLAAGICLADHSGTIEEVLNSGGYTYVLLEEDEQQVWLAGPESPLAVGGSLDCEQGFEMLNFSARSLDRTFERIWFVNSFGPAPAADAYGGDPHAGLPGFSGHGKQDDAHPAKPEQGSISKAGFTVEELFFGAELLEGKTVELRGLVVKYNSGILGRNWVHVMDGSGEPGGDDLTVTSMQECGVGDLVLVEGKLATHRDFGSGYRYPVILEDATITVEQAAEEH